MRHQLLLICSTLLLFCACNIDLPEDIGIAYEQLPKTIDFNFHVQPILSDRCYSCHGPDEAARKAGLRFDLAETAFEALESGNGYPIVKGNINKSQLVQRILSTDPELVMPTPESNLTLSTEEKATLIKWIDQGAEWKDHWAFTAPTLPEIPQINDENSNINNPIDNFVLAQLPFQNLAQNPQADKERLIRRVALDLTGLSPSIAEIDDFLVDNSSNAYEKVVDRLLASDAYGERMAMDWMDLSRYADSHGMHADGYRMMWQWRDWVIDAFNDNMPYDQFVTWQLAGDLFPNATTEQKLATAFNRNHPMTGEGGAVDEEFRLEYVFDRSETMATAFMGLTLECARCHDHKFDPISQEEYFQTAAFFNNVKELGMTGDDGNFGPMLMLPDNATTTKLAALKSQIEEKQKEIQITEKEIIATKNFIEELPADYQPSGLVLHAPLDKMSKNKLERWASHIFDNNNQVFSRNEPKIVEGKVGNAIQIGGDYDELFLEKVGIFEAYEPYSGGAWINTSKRKANKTQVILGTAGDKNNAWRGWDFHLDTLNRLSVRLIHSLPHNYCKIITKDSIKINDWTHVFFTYNGSGNADGLALYINGKKAETFTPYNRLYKSIHPATPNTYLPTDRNVRVGRSYRAFTGEDGIFIGKLDEIRLYDRTLMPEEVAALAGIEITPTYENIQQIFVQKDKSYKSKQQEIRELQAEYWLLQSIVPEVMVMEEMPKIRPMFVYDRGEYSNPTYEVGTNTPKSVGVFPSNLPPNRLGLSKWLFDSKNPLTARVAVNRSWQQLFGRGIVKTPHDFGIQGALPTHPKLLDWLAIQYQESGWDTKALLKLIVMSATYQQSSKTSREALQIDPENVYLARGASYRLSAEMIRDNALNASGLLVRKIGGESVRPYQPEGLWIEKGNFSSKLLRYKETKGDSLYRRSLYTFVKRTSPHPAMTAFDAPNRDVCTVQRESTNTPLQALVLLNDPQFVEAAKVMAERMQKKGGETLEEKITFAFRLSTGRRPKTEEIKVLKTLYEKQQQYFAEQPEKAQELLAVGEYPIEDTLDPMQTAVYAVLASTMLNHDEAYTKR